MVDEVSFAWLSVGVEAALVGHGGFQLLNNPVRELEALDGFGLVLLFRRHLLERDLGPNRLPSGGVGFVDGTQVHEIEVGLGVDVVVAVVAMEFEKIDPDSVEVAGHDLAGKVGLGCSGGAF